MSEFQSTDINMQNALIDVDLHLHSNLSDGSLSVRDLIWEAKKSGIKTISITDHESIDSFGYIKNQNFGIKIIPGVELKTIHKDRTIELLAYDIAPTQDFVIMLQCIRGSRIRRMRRILPKVNEYLADSESGLCISEQTLREICPNSNFHTSHIAGLIQNSILKQCWTEKKNRIGVPADTNDIRSFLIENWFGPGCIFYEPHDIGLFPSITQTLDMVRDMAGSLILAHPGKLKDQCVDELDMEIFDGIETFYRGHSLSEIQYFHQIAVDGGLKDTAGSDFHGDFTPNINLGSQPLNWCIRGRKTQTLLQ